MSFALFGKLPAKRDFVSRHVPAGFSTIVEPWLHEGIAISRNVMGEAWREAYLSAPIWRFWLPPGLTGQGMIGALMPSVDGVGRYFPLVIMVAAPAGGGFAHPSYDPHAAWFDAVEGILLGALGEDVALNTVLAWMGRVRDPMVADAAHLIAPGDKDRVQAASPPALGPGLHRLRRAAPAPYTGTAWWTTGGVDYPPIALAWDAMPETTFFREMLVPPKPEPGAVAAASDNASAKPPAPADAATPQPRA